MQTTQAPDINVKLGYMQFSTLPKVTVTLIKVTMTLIKADLPVTYLSRRRRASSQSMLALAASPC